MGTFSVVSDGPDNTARIAATFAQRLRPGDVILLSGDLAAGKTTFVKAVAAALKSPDVVTSPTFTLAQFYPSGSVPLLHIDTYRLDTVEEYRDLGMLEFQDDSVSLIEWGEKVASEFPDHLAIRFADAVGDHRTVTFSSASPRWTPVLGDLAADLSRDSR